MQPDLKGYDLILVNTSGGKDSSVTAWHVKNLAREAGVLDRVLLVHATFGEEWQGTVELVKRQAAALELPLEICSRGENLLDYVQRRGKWPSSAARYCTSEFKRAPIDKVIRKHATIAGRQVRVLNIMGLRAEESPARAKRNPFEQDKRRTNSKRVVDTWLPIFEMSEKMVWQVIRAQNLEQHPAYAAGMPRLSCVFCVFAPKPALILAGKLNRALLEQYVAVEEQIGHSFKANMTIKEILEAVERDEQVAPIASWQM